MLDTLIRGAKIIDGTGKAAFTADVGILDGMIAAVGNLPDAQAFSTIEAAGRCLTPGFIDMHRHADAAVFRKDFGRAELCQGLTTISLNIVILFVGQFRPQGDHHGVFLRDSRCAGPRDWRHVC